MNTIKIPLTQGRFAVVDRRDGLPDEDVHDAVSYFVEASEYDVQHAVGVLFDADVIGRSTSRENWRLA